MALLLLDTRRHIVNRKTVISVLLFTISVFVYPATSQSNDIQSVQSYMDILEGKSFPEDIVLNTQNDRIREEQERHLADDAQSDRTDLTAAAGRLFTYSLPSHFAGEDVFNLQIAEVGQDHLPEWLDFDEMVNEILGVPSDEHVGTQNTIQITASNMSQPSLSHVFTLNVVEDNLHSDGNKKSGSYKSDKLQEESIKCPPGSSVTSASVTVDVNIDQLLPKEMVSMIKKLASHLGMPEDWLKLVPVGDRPMSDPSALVAGAGDVNEIQTPGAFLQWVVGCGNVQGYHMPILQQLESTSGDGTMSQALGQGVIGWHVTNSRPTTSNRIKRMTRDSRARSNNGRRSRKKGLRRKNKNKVVDAEEEEEGSGVTILPEPEEGTTPIPIEIPPIATDKPHHTHKPRPEKTTGRHFHNTIHPPKHTDTITEPTATALMPTRVVVTTPTALPETPTKSAPPLPEVSITTTVSKTTPPLPEIVTTPLMVPDVIFSSPVTPSSVVTTTKEPSIPLEEEDKDFTVENPLVRIEVFVGDILEYQVPENTFKDSVDDNSKSLKLKLLTADKHSLSRDSWIWFDDKSRTIFGMPLDYHVGETEYILMAVNSANKVATDTFTVKVAKRSMPKKLNHEFTVIFDLDYEKFTADTKLRLEVLTKIARAYGDPDLSKITVTSVKQGSVQLSWTNNSIPTDSCPMDEIRHLVSYILTPDNSVNQSFLDAMAPIEVIGAGANPKGTCDTGKHTTVVTTSEKPAMEMRKTSDTDKFISTILPVIIIVAMIILACIIACCLYRKKRKGKMSDEDNSTFVTKGIPIIFAEELEDKPDPPTKPLIMSKEKPPLPPPEYPNPKSSSGGSPPSTPGSGHSEPLLDQDDPYTRPPPMAGNTGSMGRRLPKTPTQQPGYRHPPPYAHVPP